MTFGVLREWELWTVTNCADYTPNVVTPFLAFTRGTSLLITVGLYGYGLARKEIYSLYFGFVLTIDAWFINLPLRWIIKDPVPIETCPSVPGIFLPPSSYGLPCGEVEHATLFVTFILLYGFIWRTRKLRAWHIALLLFYQTFLVYAFDFFQYNSPVQIITAAALGAFFALLAQLIFFRLIFPNLRNIMGWTVVEWMDYGDTLCLGKHEQKPRKI